MKNLLKSFSLAFQQRPAIPAPEDWTIYRIDTTFKHYCGRIIYQDDVVIKLKIARPKPVKILKSNIEKMSIVQSAIAKQYYQMHNPAGVQTKFNNLSPQCL